MPTILVLGGVGFVGRNLVRYLVEEGLADEIRVADKVIPATAWFSTAVKAAFESDKVTFKQANLVNAASAEKCFAREDEQPWDIVINLAAETKYSQVDAIYEEKVISLSTTVADQAVQNKAKIFIHVSTAQVYDADKKPSSEKAKLKPWTGLARHHLKAEQELTKMEGLNLVIVRPVVIYGPGDTQGITPRLITGRVYQHLGEEMKCLWTKELKINTVHVRDVARALWHLGTHHLKDPPAAKGEVYNLADQTNTDQETVNGHIRNIFKIQTGFQGSIISNFAKLHLESVTEDVNDKHMEPWSEILKNAGISNSPLTPYLDQELLYNNSLCVDGSKIESTGFTYEVPKMTEEKLMEVIAHYQDMGVWPKE